MNYVDMLQEAAQKNNSIVCMGADPVIERIPLQNGNIEEKITRFYSELIEAAKGEDVLPGAIKPQYAFYAQYGFEGLRALKNVCDMVRKEKIPLILDAKRGDIGATNEAYTKECYELWGVDCVTVNPFLGTDSIEPWMKWCETKGKGVYILNRTSNIGAKDLQDLDVHGRKLYEIISDKILEWGKNGHGNVGAVVGAPSIQEFSQIAKRYGTQQQKVPFLIPGVGTQGGSASDVVKALREANYDLHIARINSSSGINFAWEKDQTDDYAGAAVKEIKKLNQEIGL